jgi:hypothetical protein
MQVPAQTREGQPYRERDSVTKVLELVASRRGWPEMSVLPVVEGSADELHAWLTAELSAQMPILAAKAQDRSLSLLGLLPDGYDSAAAVLAVFATTVQGVYLSTRGIIVLRRDLSPMDARATLTHEVVHAYEDRLFGLGANLNYQPRQGDRIAACHAMAEGEATRFEVEVARAELGTNGTDFTDEDILRRLNESLSNVELPELVRRSVVAPYSDGYRFVSYLYRTGGWKLVDAVWRRGLADTAELLHPERWVAANGTLSPRPTQHALPKSRYLAVMRGAKLVFEESLGEQGLRILLEQAVPVDRAAELASTWRDDNLFLLRSDNEERLAWLLRAAGPDQARMIGETMRTLVLGTEARGVPCRTRPLGAVAVHVIGPDIVVAAIAQTDTVGGAKPQWGCKRLLEWARSAAGN